MVNTKHAAMFPYGEIFMPPSKSAAHRAIICAGLANGESLLENVLLSDDIAATVSCMREYGAEIAFEADSMSVSGIGADGLLISKTKPSQQFDCGESGSTLRFMIPLAAILSCESVFTGQERLMSRPLEPYLTALSERGAVIVRRGGTVSVSGPITPGKFFLPGNVSSQFVSGLLMSLPMLDGDSETILTSPLESSGYVDLTLEVMAKFGVTAERVSPNRFFIKGNQRYSPRRFMVEADYSNAAFFLVSSVLGAECECLGLYQGSKQGDRRILSILESCGAVLTRTANGGIIARAGRLTARDIDISDIPDLLPPIAVLFAFCGGTSHITNAGRLRYKESDRLQTVTDVLKTLGGDISVSGDGLCITGSGLPRGGTVKSYNDHRIAMMAAVAAIRCAGDVFIEGFGCVSKSYPGFWRDFEKVQKSELKRC